MKQANVIRNMRKNSKFLNESIIEIVDIILDVLYQYSKEDQLFINAYENDDFDDIDLFDDDDNAIDDNDNYPDTNDTLEGYGKCFVDDSDIVIQTNPLIYGEYSEVNDSMPIELQNIITFEDHGVKFGKFTKFGSVEEFLDNVEQLSKRIRPSRGNLTAPQFRNLVEEWRLNMIEDAMNKNGIELSI